jgi:hypothetical protein
MVRVTRVGCMMLYYAQVFLIVALVAGLLGLTGVDVAPHP